MFPSSLSLSLSPSPQTTPVPGSEHSDSQSRSEHSQSPPGNQKARQRRVRTLASPDPRRPHDESVERLSNTNESRSNTSMDRAGSNPNASLPRSLFSSDTTDKILLHSASVLHRIIQKIWDDFPETTRASIIDCFLEDFFNIKEQEINTIKNTLSKFSSTVPVLRKTNILAYADIIRLLDENKEKFFLILEDPKTCHSFFRLAKTLNESGLAIKELWIKIWLSSEEPNPRVKIFEIISSMNPSADLLISILNHSDPQTLYDRITEAQKNMESGAWPLSSRENPGILQNTSSKEDLFGNIIFMISDNHIKYLKKKLDDNVDIAFPNTKKRTTNGKESKPSTLSDLDRSRALLKTNINKILTAAKEIPIGLESGIARWLLDDGNAVKLNARTTKSKSWMDIFNLLAKNEPGIEWLNKNFDSFFISGDNEKNCAVIYKILKKIDSFFEEGSNFPIIGSNSEVTNLAGFLQATDLFRQENHLKFLLRFQVLVQLLDLVKEKQDEVSKGIVTWLENSHNFFKLFFHPEFATLQTHLRERNISEVIQFLSRITPMVSPDVSSLSLSTISQRSVIEDGVPVLAGTLLKPNPARRFLDFFPGEGEKHSSSSSEVKNPLRLPRELVGHPLGDPIRVADTPRGLVSTSKIPPPPGTDTLETPRDPVRVNTQDVATSTSPPGMAKKQEVYSSMSLEKERERMASLGTEEEQARALLREEELQSFIFPLQLLQGLLKSEESLKAALESKKALDSAREVDAFLKEEATRRHAIEMEAFCKLIEEDNSALSRKSTADRESLMEQLRQMNAEIQREKARELLEIQELKSRKQILLSESKGITEQERQLMAFQKISTMHKIMDHEYNVRMVQIERFLLGYQERLMQEKQAGLAEEASRLQNERMRFEGALSEERDCLMSKKASIEEEMRACSLAQKELEKERTLLVEQKQQIDEEKNLLEKELQQKREELEGQRQAWEREQAISLQKLTQDRAELLRQNADFNAEKNAEKAVSEANLAAFNDLKAAFASLSAEKSSVLFKNLYQVFSEERLNEIINERGALQELHSAFLAQTFVMHRKNLEAAEEALVAKEEEINQKEADLLKDFAKREEKLKGQVARIALELENVRKERDSFASKETEHNQEILAHNARLESSLQALKEAQTELSSEREIMEEERRLFALKVNEMKEEYASNLKKLKEERDAFHKERESANKRGLEERASLEQKKLEWEMARAALLQKNREIESEETKQFQEARAELSRQQADFNTQKAVFDSNLAAFNDRKAVFDADLASKEKEHEQAILARNARLESSLKALKEARAELSRERKRMEEERTLSALKLKEMKEAHASDLNKLKEERDAFNNKQKADFERLAAEEVASFKEKESGLLTDLKKSTEEIERLKKAQEALREQIQSILTEKSEEERMTSEIKRTLLSQIADMEKNVEDSLQKVQAAYDALAAPEEMQYQRFLCPVTVREENSTTSPISSAALRTESFQPESLEPRINQVLPDNSLSKNSASTFKKTLAWAVSAAASFVVLGWAALRSEWFSSSPSSDLLDKNSSLKSETDFPKPVVEHHLLEPIDPIADSFVDTNTSNAVARDISNQTPTTPFPCSQPLYLPDVKNLVSLGGYSLNLNYSYPTNSFDQRSAISSHVPSLAMFLYQAFPFFKNTSLIVSNNESAHFLTPDFRLLNVFRQLPRWRLWINKNFYLSTHLASSVCLATYSALQSNFSAMPALVSNPIGFCPSPYYSPSAVPTIDTSPESDGGVASFFFENAKMLALTSLATVVTIRALWNKRKKHSPSIHSNIHSDVTVQQDLNTSSQLSPSLSSITVDPIRIDLHSNLVHQPVSPEDTDSSIVDPLKPEKEPGHPSSEQPPIDNSIVPTVPKKLVQKSWTQRVFVKIKQASVGTVCGALLGLVVGTVGLSLPVLSFAFFACLLSSMNMGAFFSLLSHQIKRIEKKKPEAGTTLQKKSSAPSNTDPLILKASPQKPLFFSTEKQQVFDTNNLVPSSSMVDKKIAHA